MSKHEVRVFLGPLHLQEMEAEIHASLFNHPSVSGRRFRDCALVVPGHRYDYWTQVKAEYPFSGDVTVVTVSSFDHNRHTLHRIQNTLFLFAGLAHVEARATIEGILRDRVIPSRSVSIINCNK